MKRTSWMQGLIRAEETAKKDGEWFDDNKMDTLNYPSYLNGGLSYFSNRIKRNEKPTVDNKALELTNGIT